MSTAAQIKATLAGRARKIALGYRQKSFLLSPGAQERIADLAKEAGSETKALEELLVAQDGRDDPARVDARDGLGGRGVSVGGFAYRAFAEPRADANYQVVITPDSPTKTVARQGRTRDTAVKKSPPKPAATRPPAQPTRITGPLDMNGNPLPHRGPTPKQPKVKK